ncbi:FUSC family protein [Brachybacterium fresconis]|uniref:FUSC family protein n=1 Tax=Brachybacterium fresconis TaxID=173363 RepID=A0ABS4YNY1_9MICO|nr:aromatic acid exporter family protein [Brachybacterium fresconis]MBP2410112.1 hypothetical protein [Brachybacterium fresconis]
MTVVSRALDAVRRPHVATDLLQILKAVVAATAAWWLVLYVLDSQMPFLAPWTALLTVQSTVFRSLSRGLQTLVASGLGILVSFLIGSLLGVHLWTFALALLVGMIGSRLPGIRAEGVAIATTAIFVLGSGFGQQQPLLDERLIEVALGVAVGVVVNLLILPPLRDRQAAAYVDSINRRMGGVLGDMAESFSESWDTDRAEEWFRETASMQTELETAWQTVRFARESGRVNPRRRIPRPLGQPGRRDRAGAGPTRSGRDVGYEELLNRVDEGVLYLRHLARTLRDASYAEGAWDDLCRERWSAIVRDAGRAIADPDADVEPVQHRLTALAAQLSDQKGLPRSSWPVYGSLITSMELIATIVDDVASDREAREIERGSPAS